MNKIEVAKHDLFSNLYQDIVNIGGLSNAVNEALKIVDSSLEAKSNAELPNYLQIKHKERSSQIMMAANERLFSVDLWNEGVRYGGWWFEDMIQAANFIKHSVELQLSVNEMKMAYSWFESETGELHEKGAEQETEQQWNEIIAWLENEKTVMRHLLQCVKISREIAQLAVLFPYTSHNTLCFSLTTGFPYLTVGPKITAWEEYTEVTFNEIETKKFNSAIELKKYIKQNITCYGIAKQGTADNIVI